MRSLRKIVSEIAQGALGSVHLETKESTKMIISFLLLKIRIIVRTLHFTFRPACYGHRLSL